MVWTKRNFTNGSGEALDAEFFNAFQDSVIQAHPTYSATAPTSPAVGQLWIDTSAPMSATFLALTGGDLTGPLGIVTTGTVPSMIFQKGFPPGTDLATADGRSFLFQTYHHTSTGTPITTGVYGLTVEHFVGDIAANYAAAGNSHGISTTTLVRKSNHVDNEHAAILAVLRDDTAAGATHSKLWGFDYTVHGAVGEQQKMIAGLGMLVNNYYNGSPSGGPSVGVAVNSMKGGGGGLDTAHSSATNFPIDIGLYAGGLSGSTNQNAGIKTGLRVGGPMVPWLDGTLTGRVLTGVQVSDWENFGLYVSGRTSGATGPAIAVASGAGKVLIGGTAGNYASALIEVMAPNSAADPLIRFGSDANTQPYSFSLGNAVGEGSWAVASGAGSFINESIAGDIIMNSRTSGKTLHLSGGTSSVISIGNDNTAKLRSGATIHASIDSTGLKLGNYGGVVRAVQTVATSGTIAISTNESVIPVTHAAAISSVIMPAGSFDGQLVTIVNRDATTITFHATVGTGRVAAGAQAIIAASEASTFVWDANYGGAGVGRWVSVGA